MLCITNVVYAQISITFMINLTKHGNLEGRLYSKCMTVKSAFRKSIQSVVNRRKKPDCQIAIGVNGYFTFVLHMNLSPTALGFMKTRNIISERGLYGTL